MIVSLAANPTFPAKSVEDAKMAAFDIMGNEISAPLAGAVGDASRGKVIVLDRRVGNCLICHRFPVENEPFQGDIGPSLSGVGMRLTEGEIRLRLVDESRINAQTLMPPYYRISDLTNVAPEYRGAPGLTAQQLEDVVAYLKDLKQ